MSFVPVVDISADPVAVGAELDEICRTAGFFQVTGHGVPGEVAERAWTAATRFFDLPPADKLSVARPDPDYPYGYIPLAGESLSQSIAGAAPPDLKEVFNAGPPSRPTRPFAGPDEAWAWSGALDQRPVAVDPAPGGRSARSRRGRRAQAEHAVLTERQLVRGGLLPADLPGAGRAAPLQAGAGRAAPDG